MKLTGKESFDYWNDKISISESSNDTSSEKERNFIDMAYDAFKIPKSSRIFVFQVNASYINRNGIKGIKKIRESIELIKEQSSVISPVFSPHESLDGISKENPFFDDYDEEAD